MLTKLQREELDWEIKMIQREDEKFTRLNIRRGSAPMNKWLWALAGLIVLLVVMEGIYRWKF